MITTLVTIEDVDSFSALTDNERTPSRAVSMATANLHPENEESSFEVSLKRANSHGCLGSRTLPVSSPLALRRTHSPKVVIDSPKSSANSLSPPSLPSPLSPPPQRRCTPLPSGQPEQMSLSLSINQSPSASTKIASEADSLGKSSPALVKSSHLTDLGSPCSFSQSCNEPNSPSLTPVMSVTCLPLTASLSMPPAFPAAQLISSTPSSTHPSSPSAVPPESPCIQACTSPQLFYSSKFQFPDPTLPFSQFMSKSATSPAQSPLLSSAYAAATPAKLSSGNMTELNESSLPLSSDSVPVLANLIYSPHFDAALPELTTSKTNQPPNNQSQPIKNPDLAQNKLPSLPADSASQPKAMPPQTSEVSLQPKEPMPQPSEPTSQLHGLTTSCLRSDAIVRESNHMNKPCSSGPRVSGANGQSAESGLPPSDLHPPTELSKDLSQQDSSQTKQDQSAPATCQDLSESAVPQQASFPESISPQSDEDALLRDNTSPPTGSRVEADSTISPSYISSSTTATKQPSRQNTPQLHSDRRTSQNSQSAPSSDPPASPPMISAHPSSPTNQLFKSTQLKSSWPTPNDPIKLSTSYASPHSTKVDKERNGGGTSNLDDVKMGDCKSLTDTSSDTDQYPRDWKGVKRAVVDGHKSSSAVSTGRRIQGTASSCIMDISRELTLSTRSVDRLTIGTTKGFSYSRESLKAASVVYGSNSGCKKPWSMKNKLPESSPKGNVRRISSGKTEVSRRPRGSIAKQSSLRESKHVCPLKDEIQNLKTHEKLTVASQKKHQHVVNSSTGQPEAAFKICN